jgi:REP element-mobilizing transposase RayT
VTLRLRRGLPSLRSRRFLAELRPSLRVACERGEFRVLHYSIQANHLHLLVESAGKEALGRGMKAISARVARAVQRAFGCAGAVLHGRYHLRILRTPREVRSALAYVLLNVRKHWRQRFGVAPPVRLDEASSGRWFDGWRSRPPDPPHAGSGPRDVASPRTWLLAAGWRRHGLIDPAEVPGR